MGAAQLEAGRGGKALGFALIVGANVLAGLTYPAQKLALEGLPAASVCALRNVVAALLFALWVRASGRGWGRYGRGEWGRIAFLGAVAYGLPLWLGIVGVGYSSAANGSILVLLEPVTIVLLAWLLLRERPRARNVLAVALGLGGAAAIVLEGGGVDLLGSELALGNLLLALHGVLWGFYTPVAKPLMDRGHDAMALCGLSVLFSLALMAPLAALEWRPGAPPIDPAGVPAALGWTLFLALTGSFAATVMWIASLRWISPAQVAGCVFLQPLAGVGVGVLLLGERLSALGLVGAGLISSGVLLTILPRAGRARPGG